MSTFVEQFLDLEVMGQSLPYILKGLGLTLLLSLILAPLGLVLGLALALGSRARQPMLRLAVRSWVNVFRALPPLVLIIVVFSALPFLGLQLPALASAIVALTLNSSAYYCEIFRAGFCAVPPGQSEAARSTGLTAAQTLRDVVLPQAVRTVLPDLASNTIEVVKSTSLVAIVAVGDLLYTATTIRSVTYNASPLTLAALVYVIILLPAVRLGGSFIERNRVPS